MRRQKVHRISRKRITCIPLSAAMAQTFAPLYCGLHCGVHSNGPYAAKTKIYLQDYFTHERYQVAEVDDNELIQTVRDLTEELARIKAVIRAGSMAA